MELCKVQHGYFIRNSILEHRLTSHPNIQKHTKCEETVKLYRTNNEEITKNCSQENFP